MTLAMVLILTFFFEGTSWLSIAGSLMEMAAFCAIFRKCGIKRWWLGLIPAYNLYILAKCAAREEDGRLVYIASIVSHLCNMGLTVWTDGNAWVMMMLVGLIASMVEFLLMIRVYLSICKLFNKKKRWIVVLLVLNFIPLLIWGLDDKTQPQWKT